MPHRAGSVRPPYTATRPERAHGDAQASQLNSKPCMLTAAAVAHVSSWQDSAFGFELLFHLHQRVELAVQHLRTPTTNLSHGITVLVTLVMLHYTDLQTRAVHAQHWCMSTTGSVTVLMAGRPRGYNAAPWTGCSIENSVRSGHAGAKAARLELLFDLHQQLLTPGAVLGLTGLSQVHAQRRYLPRAEASAAALELVHLRGADVGALSETSARGAARATAASG